MEENEKNNLNLAFELAKRKIDIQNSIHTSLESKIGILLGFIGTMAASSIVLLLDRTFLLGVNIFTIGIIGIYVTLVFLIIASQTKTFLDPPDFPTFYSDDSLAKENGRVKNQVIADMVSAHEKNNGIQTFKAKMYNFAVYCFLASLALLFLGIIEK